MFHGSNPIFSWNKINMKIYIYIKIKINMTPPLHIPLLYINLARLSVCLFVSNKRKKCVLKVFNFVKKFKFLKIRECNFLLLCFKM